MIRSLCVLLLLVLSMPTWSAAQETPPEPPEAAPAPPADTAPTSVVESHVRRHRMSQSDEGVLIIEQRQLATQEELQAEIEALKAKIDEFEARGEVGSDELAREMARLKLAEHELELLKLRGEVESLDIDLPELVVPGVRTPRIIVDPDGQIRVPRTPEGTRRWRKKSGDKVAIFAPVYVSGHQWIEGAAVSIFENVYVDGHVEEDVVSIGGNIYVTGSVDGNVVAPFGEVYLQESGQVDGDIVAIQLFDDGGYFGGQFEEVTLPRIGWLGGGVHSFLALLITLALSTVVLAVLLGLLVQVAAPANVARVEEKLRHRPVASFFGGLLVQILSFPVWLLLVVTVIGIPVAFLALPLVYLAALVLGFAALSCIVGRSLLERDRREPSAWLVFLVGALLLHAPLLLGLAVRLSVNGQAAGPVTLVANLIAFIGLSVLYIGSTLGMGAAVFSRLGTRARKPRAGQTQPGAVDMPPPPQAGRLPGSSGPAPNAT
jgi:hypothetical protein